MTVKLIDFISYDICPKDLLQLLHQNPFLKYVFTCKGLFSPKLVALDLSFFVSHKFKSKRKIYFFPTFFRF